MAFILDDVEIPTRNRKKPKCRLECDTCGVDYSKCDEEDEENIHDDGYGTHW